jgi:hypothetical protein
MSDPYRGFMELPLALFQALQDCAEAVVANAVDTMSARQVYATPHHAFAPADDLLLSLVRGHGFVAVATERSPMLCEWKIAARCACGAWSEVAIDEMDLFAAPAFGGADLVVSAMERLGCYCVRRAQ